MSNITPEIVHLVFVCLGFCLIIDKEYISNFFGALICFYVGFSAYQNYATVFAGYSVFIMVCFFFMCLGIVKAFKKLL